LFDHEFDDEWVRVRHWSEHELLLESLENFSMRFKATFFLLLAFVLPLFGQSVAISVHNNTGIRVIQPSFIVNVTGPAGSHVQGAGCGIHYGDLNPGDVAVFYVDCDTDGTDNSWTGSSYQFWGEWDVSPNVQVHTGWSPVLTISSGAWLEIGLPDRTNANVVVTNENWVVQNNTPYRQDYTLTDNTTGQHSTIALDPGQSGTVTLPVYEIDGNGSATGSQSLDPSVYNSDFSSGYTNFQMDLSNTNFFTNVLSNRFNSDAMLTNGPIIWSSNASTPPSGSALVFDPTLNSTLQAAANKQFSDNQVALANQQSALSLLSMMATGRLTTVVVTNNISGVLFTNNIVLGTTGQYGNIIVSNLNLSSSNLATETTLEGISNLLGYAGTNFSSGTDVVYDLTGPTNYDQAVLLSTPATGSPMDTVETWFSSMVSGIVLPDAPPEGPEGGNGVGDMTLDFGIGGVMDFNPLHHLQNEGGTGGVPMIFYYAQMLIKWLITIYYVKRCLADSRWAISVCNQSHGSMNPAAIKRPS
jgi:hypothetical protein